MKEGKILSILMVILIFLFILLSILVAFSICPDKMPHDDIYTEGEIKRIDYTDGYTVMVIEKINSMSKVYTCYGYIGDVQEGKMYRIHFRQYVLDPYCTFVDAEANRHE